MAKTFLASFSFCRDVRLNASLKTITVVNESKN